MVTRGLYPRLVRRNVKKHLETLSAVGVENFTVEVVTVRIISEFAREWYRVKIIAHAIAQSWSNERRSFTLFRITL